MTTKKKRRFIIWGGILVLILVIRAVLPSIVLHYANKTLADMKGYYGHVRSIDIDLYRGAYKLDSIYINKKDSANSRQTPFFSSRSIDLSIEWKALLDGSIVGELEFESPRLLFTKDKTEPGQVAKDTNDFRKILKKFMPLRINRFLVVHGEVRYIDHGASPKVDIALSDAYILATNLKNTVDKKEKLPSDVTVRAKVYEGNFSLKMKLDALSKRPAFDLNGQLNGCNLVLLNDFFKAYGKFDVSKGRFGLYTEFAAAHGKFKGYVKPIIKDLKVKGTEDRNDKFLQKAKETAIDVAGKILENKKKDQVATKVPVEGTFGNTSIDTWEAVGEVLKNAFIEALMPSVDNEIDLGSVATVQPEKKKGFFKKIFSVFKKDDKKEPEKVEKEQKPVRAGLRRYSTATVKDQ